MKNSRLTSSFGRKSDKKLNSDQISSDIAVKMETCSLEEIPPNQSKDTYLESLERYVKC